jgi:hypothetical protein
MGQGYRHSNAYGKAQQNWFGKCNLVTVSANGTFDLVPTELPSNGIQALRVVRDLGSPNTSSYYVEYRQPLGAFDTFASISCGERRFARRAAPTTRQAFPPGRTPRRRLTPTPRSA